MDTFQHVSVLLSELIDGLHIQPGHLVVDCTAGGGGHTAEILKRLGTTGKVLAFDRDAMAMETLYERFAAQLESGQIELVKAPYSQLRIELERRGLLGKVDGLCADIGVSSPQLDRAERGFSFAKDGPLDMRMDQSQALDAAAIINTYPEEDLLRIFRDYGEDPQARPIVRAILRRRATQAITRTLELADLVASAVHYRERSRKHPATKVFQALRIAVNGELEELETLLASIPEALAPGGRCAIISFHSLEDRLVKQSFKQLVEGDKPRFAREVPLTAEQLEQLSRSTFKLIKPFPLLPAEEEQALNPRSRSAKLRVLERLCNKESS
jgi:16S rRNA (cytosine1402-N4)-methyltransferase